MGCPHCASGNHAACIEENKTKTTGCPGCCQHKVVGGDGVPMATVEDKFAHLRQEMYEVSEIAFMTGLNIRTVRGYLKKPSKKYPDRKFLVGSKFRGTYRVLREDLIKFFVELYGG